MALSRLFLFAILLISSTVLFASKIYTWTDEDGKKHYSNTPDVENAQEIEIGETNAVTLPKKSAYPPLKTSQPSQPKVSIEITSPQNDETIWSNDLTFSVSYKTNAPKETTTIIWLDGAKQENTGDGPSGSYQTTPGEHKLKATLVNKAGKVIAQSASITFYIRGHNTNTAPPAF